MVLFKGIIKEITIDSNKILLFLIARRIREGFMKRAGLWLSIPFLIIMLAAVFYAGMNRTAVNKAPLSFQIESFDHSEKTDAWYSDGVYYAFLPSYAEMDRVFAVTDPSYTIYIEGAPLTEKTDLSLFALGEKYDITVCRGKKTAEEKLCFLHSANVAAMFINTQSGSMERIHRDKKVKETVQVVLIDENGDKTYTGLRDRLNGRGNGTWLYDKKPYLLNLSKPHEMLGMPAAEKWVLLSNPADKTNIRDKVIYDLARQTGFAWAPDSRYVDLYLNGEYAGLYLLSEKVEMQENRLDLHNGANGAQESFLCKNELFTRWNVLQNPFMTDYGRPVEITSPDSVPAYLKERIKADVNLMERVILSGDSLALLEYIDIDSWARKYLIDEITANIDADLASSYFYCEYKDGKPLFYAGPIWDYDQAFGASRRRNDNPRAFYASSEYESPVLPTPYYHALYKNGIFYNRVVELYKNEFLPRFTELAQQGITRQALAIFNASQMNKVRWFPDEEDISGAYEIAFLQERIAFLNDAWLSETPYYTVQIEPEKGGFYSSYAVKPGEKLSAASVFGGETPKDAVWIDKDTGEEFNFDTPLTKDTTLLLKTPEKGKIGGFISRNKALLLCMAPAGLCGVMLVLSVRLDLKRNKPKKEGAK